MRITRYSVYASPHETTGVDRPPKVHHCLVGPEGESPDDNGMLFMICDPFEVPDHAQPEEILGLARQRWDEREAGELSMAELFYSLMDDYNLARKQRAASDGSGHGELLVAQTGLDTFSIAYVLERIQQSPIFKDRDSITVVGRDGAVSLADGKITYRDLEPQ